MKIIMLLSMFYFNKGKIHKIDMRIYSEKEYCIKAKNKLNREFDNLDQISFECNKR